MNRWIEKNWRLLLAGAALLAALIVCGVNLYYFNFARINGASYFLRSRSLDLSGETLESPQALSRFSRLEELDLRGSQVSPEVYRQLKELLPQCNILWELPFQGSLYPLDTGTVTVTSLSVQEAELLALLPELKTLDALACQDYEALMTLQRLQPQCQVNYTLELAGQSISSDARQAELRDAGQEDLLTKLAWLPKLEQVRFLGELPSSDALSQLSQRYPEIRFSWLLETVGAENDTRSLSLADNTPGTIQELESILSYLPQLETLELGESPIGQEALFSLEDSRPGLSISFDMQVMGVPTPRNARELDLSGVQITDLEALEQTLARMPELEKVIMVGCGISNEEMDALNRRHEDIRFVWSVKIGLYCEVRTDITTFMPYQLKVYVTSKDLTELKYCQDLVCIDVGHYNITDCDFAAYMPNLKYLILADTKVTSLEPLRGLKNLIYLEAFMCPITDYTPLQDCPNLQDLNIVHNPQGMQGLEELTWLKRLWLRPQGTVERDCTELLAHLRAALPDTQVVYAGEATAEGWRDHQNYRDMRDMLGLWYFP